MGVLRASNMSQMSWIEHGFGTRDSGISQDGMASLQQVHSGTCLTVSGPGCAGQGDGLVTAARSLALSIRTADCYPILLADTRTRCVAAIHAGWRGTAAGIVRQALLKMEELCGAAPQGIVAAIGPGIGKCCYEVGEEVARRFGLDRAGRVDLASANRQMLIDAGVPASQIETLEVCTFCDLRFYSFRREKDKAGRMISYIRIKERMREDTEGAAP